MRYLGVFNFADAEVQKFEIVLVEVKHTDLFQSSASEELFMLLKELRNTVTYTPLLVDEERLRNCILHANNCSPT